MTITLHRNSYQLVLVCLLSIFIMACSERKNTAELTTEKLSTTPQHKTADVVVLGAGISGLSVAIEAASQGHSVLVLDMASIFGGHAVVAAGVLNIPMTLEQEQRGIKDSAELAINDFLRWGEDANEPWVRQYVNLAKTDIFNWTRELGIDYVAVVRPPGNSVPRVHVPKGNGLALVSAIYRRALSFDNITFRYNTRADDLITENGRIAGVKTTHTRSGNQQNFYSNAVVVATGGFQNNIERVLANWPTGAIKPERILAGSGLNSKGSGLDMVANIGGQIERLDHQWNYVTGIPDPSFEGGLKGLSFFTLNGTPKLEIWLNAEGQRFTNECSSPKFNLPKVLNQTEQKYWMLFDSKNKPNVTISGPGWTQKRLNKDIYSNPELVKVAHSFEELAVLMGLSEVALKEAVARFNSMVEKGIDTDHGKFGVPETAESGCNTPQQIDTPPYYAVTRYPLARKSMGGIKIDLDTRVINNEGKPIPGLYAVGEATGFAGINGKAGLEGTFLGPSIVTGKTAGRSIAQEQEATIAKPKVQPDTFTIHQEVAGKADCDDCHQNESTIKAKHNGYLHFNLVHTKVAEKNLPCATCHSALFPYNPKQHRISPLRLSDTCVICHGGGD